MADGDKNIIITPNIGSTDDPNITFVGSSGSVTGSLTAYMRGQNSGTFSFEGSSGAIFSFNNSMTGTIFSVGTVSGYSMIRVQDDGNVYMAAETGNLLIKNLSFKSYLTGNSPSAFVSGTGTIFSRLRSGKDQLCFLGMTGTEYPLQPNFVGSSYHLIRAIPNTTTFFSGGLTIGSTGTLTAASVAAGSFYSLVKKVNLVTSANAGTYSGIWTTTANWLRGDQTIAKQGGFFAITRLIPSTVVTNPRYFVGFHTGTAAPTNVDPASLLNTIGVSFNSGESDIYFIHNDGAGTATKTATNLGTLNNVANTLHEIRIYCPPGGNNVYMSVEVIPGTGSSKLAEYNSAGSTDIPVTSTLLGFRAYMGSNSTAAATTLSIVSVYVESDN